MRETDSTILSQRGLFSQRMHTSLGWIRAISKGQHLIYLDRNQTGWTDHDQPDDVSRETITQLTAYFHGELHSFDLPLLPAGISQSRRRWLNVMATIPFGTTISYAAFAAAASHPKAARAAGTACLPIRYRLFIPVIGYCAQVGSLAIMAAAVVCRQHIRIIYNIKRFLSAKGHSNLVSTRQTAPDLAVHLIKEIIIAL